MSNDFRLSDLHSDFIAELQRRLKEGEEVATKEGVMKLDCSAATLKVIKDFLADNDINCTPKPGTESLVKNLPFPKK